MLLKMIERWRMRLEQDMDGSSLRWKMTSALYVTAEKSIATLRRVVSGRVLDVGCGKMPFHQYIQTQVESYDGLDIERRSPKTKYLCSAEKMDEVHDDSYDTVLSMSSLEHMPRPWLAIREMSRVCKKGGTIVLLVPHLSRLHEEPHDYFRFTQYGLRSMGEDAGLKVESTEITGGLFTFLGHQVSTIVICLAWGVPIVKWFVFYMNYWFVVLPCVMLDRLFKTTLKFPMGILCVFTAP